MIDLQPRGTIRIGEQQAFGHHRSGWAIAIDALRPEHSDVGILFDGFLDKTFNQKMNPRYQQNLPFVRPWTGFFHNPHSVPRWFPDEPKIERMVASDKFQQSLPHCLGLFRLSNDLAEFLRARVDVEVSALVHPTEIPPAQFDFESFLDNADKKVISIGWWLRRTLSIQYLPLDTTSPYRKMRLKLGETLLDDTQKRLWRLEFVQEWRNRKLDGRYRDNTVEHSYLPPSETMTGSPATSCFSICFARARTTPSSSVSRAARRCSSTRFPRSSNIWARTTLLLQFPRGSRRQGMPVRSGAAGPPPSDGQSGSPAAGA